jgi:Domain of unknown function (DUF4157)
VSYSDSCEKGNLASHGPTDEQHDWASAFLGVDTSAYTNPALIPDRAEGSLRMSGFMSAEDKVNDAVLGADQLAPHGHDSKHLMAHELTHVVQQRHDAVAPQQEAAGAGPVAVAAGTGAGTAREEDDSWTTRLRRKVNAVKEEIPQEYRDTLSQATDSVADTVVSTILSPVLPASLTDGAGSSLLRGAAKLAAGEADPVADLKDFAGTKVQEGIGAAKGVVTQVTEVVDTGLWLGKEYKSFRDKAAEVVGGKEGTAGNSVAKQIIDFAIPGSQGLRAAADAGDQLKSLGLIDKQTGITAPLTEKLNSAVKWAEQAIGGTPSDPEMFTPAEKAEIAASIGTQVALSFTGAEEIKVAMNVAGALGGVRGVVETARRDPNWEKNPAFWSSLIGMALSIVGLKHSLATKITTSIMKFGGIAAAVLPLTQMVAAYVVSTRGGVSRVRRARIRAKSLVPKLRMAK